LSLPKVLSAVLLVCGCATLAAQSAPNAPQGVHIKPASEADIKEARAKLQDALTSGQLPNDWLNKATSIGPTLWKTLKPLTESRIKGNSTNIVFISAKPPIQADGIGAITPEHHRIIWEAMMKTWPALKTATIRPASAQEILYYWGTIPFDIEEPFFAIDTGNDVFIANLPRMKGHISFFWIDLVGPYEDLRPKP